MTKKSIFRAFVAAIVFFVFLLIGGILISVFDHTQGRIVFSTFKDLLPLFLGIVAAWLGYCVQRRSAYQQQLRILWSKLVEAVQVAAQYTYLQTPTQDQYANALTKLSIAIEEVRGVFVNLGENDSEIGLYPFEPIKDIRGLISDLGFGESFNKKIANESRKKVFALWKDVRKEILKEFDREEPTFPHSHWSDLEKHQVYEENKIEKRSS